MAKGNVKNSQMLAEAANLIAEYMGEEVCDILAEQYDGDSYCPSGCPRLVDDGCVLHMLRLRCGKKTKKNS